MNVARWLLFGFGYPASIVVIARFRPVVRERRLTWLVVHHLAVACIVVGWATKRDITAVIVNASWLVASSVWYIAGHEKKT